MVERGLVTAELAGRAASSAGGRGPPAGLEGAGDQLASRMLRLVHEGLPQRRGARRRVGPWGSGCVPGTSTRPATCRMPRYVRGRTGTVDRSHRCFELADASARGESVIEPLYTVRFEAADLWGAQGRPGDGVRVDLWESYLEAPAGDER